VLKLLHLHSSFAAGGKELRAARLINAFGPGVEHVIVSAQPGELAAAAAIDAGIPVSYPDDFPALAGRPTPGRLQRIARAMQGYDLILTYNWGAMDAVMAHTLFAKALNLPPLVHHEDGFNQDEAVRLKPSRNWFRRIALGRCAALVVPSTRLEGIALNQWHQPRWRVRRVPNGVTTAAYGGTPKLNVLPRLVKRKDEYWLGTIAGLRRVKNLPRLVRAFSALADDWQLVILGEGPEREAIMAEAMRLEIADRVHLPGFAADPAKVIGLFDLFALSSDSEQFPISVVEAMAAGLAVAATDVGDIASIVTEENRRFLVPVDKEGDLADALEALSLDPALRARLGAANQARARAEFDEAGMIATYREIYAAAMGRTAFP